MNYDFSPEQIRKIKFALRQQGDDDLIDIILAQELIKQWEKENE